MPAGPGPAAASVLGGDTADRSGDAAAAGLAGAAAGGTGVEITAVGIMSGVAGMLDGMAFPHDWQNLVPAFACAPQFRQIEMASTTGGEDGARPNGAAHAAQNFAPGCTAVPHEGQTLLACADSLPAANGAPQLRQNFPEPLASALHLGHFITSS
jgi:hypothetical protein